MGLVEADLERNWRGAKLEPSLRRVEEESEWSRSGVGVESEWSRSGVGAESGAESARGLAPSWGVILSILHQC